MPASQVTASTPAGSSQDDRIMLQTRFYVAVRRASGRVIDLVWFRQNAEYAKAVLDFAETISDKEVRETARRLRYPEFYG